MSIFKITIYNIRFAIYITYDNKKEIVIFRQYITIKIKFWIYLDISWMSLYVRWMFSYDMWKYIYIMYYVKIWQNYFCAIWTCQKI